jgi:Carboxypeptidase regulatory-like domain
MASILLVIAIGLLWSTRSVSAAADGNITGTVKLDGAAPHMKGIDMSKDPFCVKQHENSPAHLENVVVGSGGGLQNVVLYISEGLSGAEASQAPPQEPVFDQKNCMYTPHVLAMDVNQKFKVATSDQTTHNIHPLPNALAGNIPWNKSQPPGAPPIETSWKTQEVAISVKCNIHPWMHGYFAVLQTPHHALSKDDGSFTLEGLPPGKYTLTAWHERFGTQTQDVTVAAGKPATADFVMKAVPY